MYTMYRYSVHIYRYSVYIHRYSVHIHRYSVHIHRYSVHVYRYTYIYIGYIGIGYMYYSVHVYLIQEAKSERIMKSFIKLAPKVHTSPSGVGTALTVYLYLRGPQYSEVENFMRSQWRSWWWGTLWM